MVTITLMERQQRNQERVSIYLDDEFAFGLHEMDAAHLRIGMELSEADIAELKARDAIQRAVEKAIQLLAHRPRSVQEIRRRLTKKEVAPKTIDEALERLERMGYVDDRAFARFWIENRQRFRPMSARGLRYELQQKGVAQSIIGELIDDIVEEDDAAYRAAYKRYRRYQGKTRSEYEKHLGSYLQRRGFSYGVIRQALDQLATELMQEDEHFFAEEDAPQW